MSRRVNPVLSSIKLISLVVAGGINQSATADDGQGLSERFLEEIIVVAQKRKEKILEVPISMTALSEASLDIRGFSQIEDLAFTVPNVSIQNSSDSRTTSFTIRGITGQTLFPGASSAVGIFVDGVYVNNPIAQSFEILDVQQIEVLRGPQGTLYGRNTTAGAINVISNRPDMEKVTGKFLLEAGDYDLKRVSGRISGPLIENTAAGSLSAAWKERDGYEENPLLGEDLNTDDNWSARGALRFLVGENTEFHLTADYLKEDRVPGALDTEPEERKTSLDENGREEREVFGGTLTIDHDFPNDLTLTSITAYRTYDFDRVGDDDLTPVAAFISPVTESTDQISQELRIASSGDQKLEWLAGLYYLHTELDGTGKPIIDPDGLFLLQSNGQFGCSTLLGLQGFPPALLPLFCSAGVGDNAISQETDTYAAFGQLSYAFTDKLSASLGLRYSIDEKEFSNVQLSTALPLFLAFVPPGVVEEDRDDEKFTPKISLEYMAQENLNIYASIASGYNAGGFNTSPISSLPASGLIYEPEDLISYEIGAKWRSEDARFSVFAAAFYLDYSDFQAFRNIEIAPGLFTPSIDNAEKAVSTGFELEATARITESLFVSASAGYADAQYSDYSNCGVSATVPAVALDCDDSQIANSPDWTGNVNATYYHPLNIANGLQLVVYGEWGYRGDVYYSVENDPESLQEGFSIFNGSVGLTSADQSWALTLWGKNLGDEDYATIAIDGLTGKVKQLGAPRTWGVRFNKSF